MGGRSATNAFDAPADKYRAPRDMPSRQRSQPSFRTGERAAPADVDPLAFSPGKETSVAQSTSYGHLSQHERANLTDTAGDLAQRSWEQAASVVQTARDTVKENPVATIAIVAGLAFAVGALWKIGQPRGRTRMESLMSRLGDQQKELPRGWRP
jgi:ElaB/YqjD/DUF883 family membrane-anchored ribosome-binding protein